MRRRERYIVVLVVMIVAMVAVVGGQAATAARPDASGAQAGSAQALLSQLAVLRRPQTAADVLPANLHLTPQPARDAGVIIRVQVVCSG